jgi:uncharacterized small protein (DUF1192 family)
MPSFKDFFIAKDSDAKKPDPKASVTPVAASPFGGGFSLPTSPALNFGGAAAPDQEIVKSLTDAAAQSKKPAYDQFRVVAESLAGVPDVQRYTMALNVVHNANKIEAADVIASLDDRLALIEREKADFENAYQSQTQSAVVGAESEAKKITERITTLQQEIATLEGQRVTKMQESGQAKVDLEQSRATFNASFEVVRSVFKRERDMLSSFLPTPVK